MTCRDNKSSLKWYKSRQRTGWKHGETEKWHFHPGICLFVLVRQRLCTPHTITQHQWICKVTGLGGIMKVKCRVQERLLMIMNYVIFLDRVGLTFILKRDYSESDSCSKQILSRSLMFNMWIESPKEYIGGGINLSPNCTHEMPQVCAGVETVHAVLLDFFLRVEPWRDDQGHQCHSLAAAPPAVRGTPPSHECQRNQLCLPH